MKVVCWGSRGGHGGFEKLDRCRCQDEIAIWDGSGQIAGHPGLGFIIYTADAPEPGRDAIAVGPSTCRVQHRHEAATRGMLVEQVYEQSQW
jgi:hypothetical protein